MANIFTGIVPKRMGRRAYWVARIVIGVIDLCLIGLAVFAFSDGFSWGKPAVAAVLLVCALLFLFTQYRFTLLTVARLHDNDMSGLFLLPYAAIQVTIWGAIAYGCLSTLLPLPSMIGVADVLIADGALHTLLIGVAAVVLLYGAGLSMFLRYSSGTPGPNRYGPAPAK